MNQLNDHLVRQSVIPPVNQSVNQFVNQSVSQLINKSINHYQARITSITTVEFIISRICNVRSINHPINRTLFKEGYT